jgi:3-oxoacyl-[acyl-carrier protein] reductase
MSLDFTDRRVVVCGGSRGIGRGIALGFARAGAAVSICARGEGPLEATRKELGAKGHAATCDLADEASIRAYIAAAAKALGGIDILINNASGFGTTDDAAGWAACVAVDLMAIVHATHAALPFLEKARDAAVVSVSSISAYRVSVRNPPYGAIKAAVNHYTATQAATLAKKGIRVNAVAPGSIEFPGGSWEQRKLAGDPLYESVRSRIPSGHLGTPDDVADVVLFLASGMARWVTGQTITVDGGQLNG